MGLLDALRGKGVVKAAGELPDFTKPVTAPADNIAPVLAAQLNAPPGMDLMWDLAFGCLSRITAMKVPAVRRGVRTIADSIAAMPMQRWAGLKLVDTGTFLAQPENWRPLSATLRETIEDLIFYPHAWWYVTARGWTNYPAAVVRLDPQYVTVTTIPGSSEIDTVSVSYHGRELPKDDLIRFDGPDEGILRLGTVEIITALKLEMAAQTYADPEIPSGVLTNTGQYRLTEAERLDLMEGWRAGARRGSTRFLDANLAYQQILAMPDQLQLVQGREESAVQIARLLNLPPHYVGAKSGDSMTYSTVASQRRDLVDISLSPYITAIEDRLSMPDRNGSPSTQKVRFDRSGLLRSDAREDAEVGEILIRSGQSSAKEQRERRGLPPLPAAEQPAPPAPTPNAEEPADA